MNGHCKITQVVRTSCSDCFCSSQIVYALRKPQIEVIIDHKFVNILCDFSNKIGNKFMASAICLKVIIILMNNSKLYHFILWNISKYKHLLINNLEVSMFACIENIVISISCCLKILHY